VGDFLTYETCDHLGTSACIVANGCMPNCSSTPTVICDSIMDELTCGAYSGCSYTNGFCTGSYNAGLLPCTKFSTNVCNTVPGCTLIPNQCSNYPCNATHSMEICVNTPGCWWHRGTCVWRGGYGEILRINAVLVVVMVVFLLAYFN